jgi:hypothetical protein
MCLQGLGQFEPRTSEQAKRLRLEPSRSASTTLKLVIEGQALGEEDRVVQPVIFET